MADHVAQGLLGNAVDAQCDAARKVRRPVSGRVLDRDPVALLQAVNRQNKTLMKRTAVPKIAGMANTFPGGPLAP